MAKRGLMAATVISVLILVCSTSNAAMKEPTPPEPTAREMGCSKSQVWRDKCEKAAEMCIYKLKVVEVNEGDPQKLSVSYPPSVWEQSKESMRDREAETTYREYRKSYDKPHSITIKRSESPVKAGKIYLFTRCTDNGRDDNDFTLLELLPDEKAERDGPQQSAQ